MDIVRNPRRLALLYFVIVTLVYLILARPVEHLNDFVKQGDYIYTASGPAGLGILDAVTPPDGGVPSLEQLATLAPEQGFTALVLQERPLKNQPALFAYLADGDGVMVANVTLATQPRRMQYLEQSATVRALAVWNDYLYVARGRSGVKVYKIKDSGELEEIKDAQFGGSVWTMQVVEDRLYLNDNNTLKVYYLRANPKKPQQLGSKDAGDFIYDIHVNDLGSVHEAYLAADGVGVIGLQISKPITATATVTPTEFMRQDTDGEARGLFRFDQYLIVADGTRGMQVLDLTEPKTPKKIKSYDTWGLSTQVWMDAAARLVYLADGASGLRVIDFSPAMKADVDANAPHPAAEGLSYVAPYLFVAQQGRGVQVLQRSANNTWEAVAFYDTLGQALALHVSPQRRLAFVADRSQLVAISLEELYGKAPPGRVLPFPLGQAGRLETPPTAEIQDVILAPDRPVAFLAGGTSGVMAVDITRPEAMVIVSTEVVNDRALGLAIGRGYLYVAAGSGGLEIIGFQDVLNLNRVAALSLPGGAEARRVALADFGDPAAPLYAYIAAAEQGLCVVRVDPPHAPSLGQCFRTVGSATDVVVDMNRRQVFVSDEGGVVQAFSIQDPLHPLALQPVRLDKPLRRLALDGAWVIASAGAGGLRALNLDQPGQQVVSYMFNDRVSQFVRSDTLLFATNGPRRPGEDRAGLQIYDVGTPAATRLLGQFRTDGDAYSVTAYPGGNPVYLADGAKGFKVLDVSDRTHPRLLSGTPLINDVRHVWVDPQFPNRTYVASGTGYLVSLDTANPFMPRVLGQVQVCAGSPAVWSATYRGDYVFVACEGGGVASVFVSNPAAMTVADRYQGSLAVHNFAIMTPYLLAASNDGVVVLNIERPWSLQALPTPAQWTGPVTAVSALDTLAFVLNAQGETGVYQAINPLQPELVSTLEAVPGAAFLTTQQQAPGKASQAMGYAAVVANPVNGFRFYKTNKDPTLKQVQVYETPGTASFYEVFNVVALRTDFYMRRLVGSLKMVRLSGLAKTTESIRKLLSGLVKNGAALLGTPWPETGVSPKALATLNMVFWHDFVLFGLIGIFISGAFFIQFVLPVKGPYQRYMAARRMVSYLMLAHGPMARVSNGNIERPDDDEKWIGPGVALVDLASAVVLEKRSLHRIPVLQMLAEVFNKPPSPQDPYGGRWVKDATRPNGKRWVSIPPNRVAGPGLVFTNGNPSARAVKWDERVWRAVDLRKQVRTTDLVQAHTRDGIEVKNRVISVFSVSEPPEVLLVTYAMPRPRIAPGRWKPFEQDAQLVAEPPDGLGAGVESLQETLASDMVERPEHLRVVQVSYRPVCDADGYYTRMAVIDDFVDELDPDDQRQIHDFVQRQRRDGVAMQPFSEQALIGLAQTGEGPFAVDRARIMAAAAARADRDKDSTEWCELPERAGIETYTNMLARQVYDNLYRPTERNDYPLPKFKGLYGKSMRNQGVLSFQFITAANGAQLNIGQKLEEGELQVYPATALTSPKVLRARGVKVIFGGFTEMNPVNDKVRDQFVNNWCARWQKHAEMTRSEYELRVMRIRHEARMHTQHDLLLTLWNMLNTAGCSQEALALRLFQALEAVGADPLTRQFMPEETISVLRMMHGWMTPHMPDGPIVGSSPVGGMGDLFSPLGPRSQVGYPSSGDRDPHLLRYADAGGDPPVSSHSHDDPSSAPDLGGDA